MLPRLRYAVGNNGYTDSMFSPIVPSFFRIFFIKKWKSSPFRRFTVVLSTSLPWLFEPDVEHHPAISPGQNRAADMG